MITTTLLKTLTIEEWKQFGEFVQSPIYNKTKKIITLWKIIDKPFPNLDNITKEWLIKKLKVTEGYLNKLLSEFKQLIDRFLIFLGIQEDDLYQDILLLKKYQEKGIARFEKALSKARTKLSKQRYTESKPVFLYDLTLEMTEHEMSMSSAKRRNSKNILSIFNKLDIFYIYEKVRYLVYTFTLNSIFPIQINQKDIIFALEFANQNHLQEIPEIHLFTQLLQVLYTEKEEEFQVLLIALERHKKNISSEMLKDLYNISNNFCYKQHVKGNDAYLKFSFKISQISEQNQLLSLYPTFMFTHMYANFVIIAVKVGQFKWAKTFTEQYKYLLPKKFQEGLYYKNLAAIAFYEKDYNKALSYSYKIPKIDVFYHINHEMLVIKSLYHLEEIEILEQKIDTFSKYIDYKRKESKKNKIAIERLKAYDHFIMIIKRLRGIAAKRNNPNLSFKHQYLILETIEEDLKNIATIVDKSWLEAQIIQLKKTIPSSDNI